MLTIEKAEEIYVYPGSTDMRYGIQGLFALSGSPKENTIHMFCSADRRTVKILCAEEGCVYLLTKRLTCGRFHWPEKGETTAIDYDGLSALIDGLSIVKKIENGGKIPQRLY